MYSNIGVYDWQTILSMLEAVAWAAVLGAGLLFLVPARLNKQKKQIVWLLFAAWAVASISLAGVQTYEYFANQRKTFEESIQMQKQYR